MNKAWHIYSGVVQVGSDVTRRLAVPVMPMLDPYNIQHNIQYWRSIKWYAASPCRK